MIHFRSDRDKGEAYTTTHVRVVVGALAALLGILGLWILIGELTRPQLSYFPSSPVEADAMYAARGSAATAAQISMIRGDLWTVAAVTTATPLLFRAMGSSPQQASQATIESVHTIADHAARLSPHDSRIWLVLAGLDFRVGGNNRRGTEMLKLSYYTGPNEISLMPLRLLIAVTSNVISDQEVQSLVRLDIQRIVMQRPDLKPAIALAYQNAQPKGRDIIKATLKAADPSFLPKLAVPEQGSDIPD